MTAYLLFCAKCASEPHALQGASVQAVLANEPPRMYCHTHPDERLSWIREAGWMHSARHAAVVGP